MWLGGDCCTKFIFFSLVYSVVGQKRVSLPRYARLCRPVRFTLDCFQIYAAWETDEVIGKELWRNLGLAMACVAVITLVLLAGMAQIKTLVLCYLLFFLDKTMI